MDPCNTCNRDDDDFFNGPTSSLTTSNRLVDLHKWWEDGHIDTNANVQRFVSLGLEESRAHPFYKREYHHGNFVCVM